MAGKRTLFRAGNFSFWSSLFSNFLNFLAPPFENPAYATDDNITPRVEQVQKAFCLEKNNLPVLVWSG